MTFLPFLSWARPRGVSIRDWVSTRPSIAQSRSVQYALSLAYVVAVRRSTHLVDPTNPKRPGVTRRTG